jgi:uncharacterized membrane protein HdeD (DUF308 family)
MVVEVTRNWWALAIRGVAAILFGLAAFFWPGLKLTVLILLFAAYALVDGVFAIVGAIRAARLHERWWPMALGGAAGITIGLIAFFFPGITALALLLLIAIWAIVTGIFEIVEAIQLREVITNEWLMGLSGLASIVFGVLLLVIPAAGALALIWLIGAYALVFGVLLLLLAFRLRSLTTGEMGGAGTP